MSLKYINDKMLFIIAKKELISQDVYYLPFMSTIFGNIATELFIKMLT